eukprot:Nitzschia sp. Nitz4//scaffold118_size93875//49178//51058//NITZ4_004790-RA/size93875-processed-gene-0.35-mRNA-1//1//CDS//3329533730//4695//frame0
MLATAPTKKEGRRTRAKKEWAMASESYIDKLREQKQEKLESDSLRTEKIVVEFEQIQTLFDQNSSLSVGDQIQSLMQDKAHQAKQLDACQTEIQRLKEELHTKQTEQRQLLQELHEATQPAVVTSTSTPQDALVDEVSDAPKIQFYMRRVEDLTLEASKWEKLFFEAAEVGERQVERLEQQAQNLRDELEQRNATSAQVQELQEVVQEKDNTIQQLEAQVEKLKADPESDPVVEAALEQVELYRQELARVRERTQHMNKRLTVGRSYFGEDDDQTKNTDPLDDEDDPLHTIMTSFVSTGDNVIHYIDELEQQIMAMKPDPSDSSEHDRSVSVITESEKAASMDELEKVKDENEQLQRSLVAAQQHIFDLESKMEVGQVGESCESGPWEAERASLQNLVILQERALLEANATIETAQTENERLRQVRDSLVGVDREMEKLIHSLQPLQQEVVEQRERAQVSSKEAASLRNNLEVEKSLRSCLERENKKMESELFRTKKELDDVRLELKQERASHEDDVALLRQEAKCLQGSIDYHKESLEVMREALREANLELLAKTGRSSLGSAGSPQTCEVIRSLQQELEYLQQQLDDVVAERDALELDSQMFHFEKANLQDQLKEAREACQKLP